MSDEDFVEECFKVYNKYPERTQEDYHDSGVEFYLLDKQATNGYQHKWLNAVINFMWDAVDIVG